MCHLWRVHRLFLVLFRVHRHFLVSVSMGECEDAKQETESCFARNKPRNKKEERETKVQGSDKRENANEAEKSLSFAWNATVLVIFLSHLRRLPPCVEVARVAGALLL